MNKTLKISMVLLGILASVAATTQTKAATSDDLTVTRECHGSGTCFVTPGGTTINGQWTENPN